MSYFEVLVEGGSDVPALREVLTRKFGLEENVDFRIHPHKGKGKLPSNPLALPDPRRQTLLDQLPAKLKGFGSYLGSDDCVVIVVDADDCPSHVILSELQSMLALLPRRPERVLFFLAVEETESWFIADENAILKAYPNAKVQRLRSIEPDAIIGAWEVLAEVLRMKKEDVTGIDKHAWAEAIAPHLDLENPKSPSLKILVEGVGKEI